MNGNSENESESKGTKGRMQTDPVENFSAIKLFKD